MLARLGIDFGTSSTVAVLRLDDGTVRPLLFDGSPSLPSAVCRQPDGSLLVGRDAVHTARRYPEAFEPHPKRLVDEETVLLGDAELPVTALIGAVLRRVADEAARVGGGEPSSVVLTHPVFWAGPRRAVLLAAAAEAGLGRPDLVAEPVAAANHFARRAADAVAIGATVVVYDLGAGTFDASVLRRTAEGFTVLAIDGRTDTGGLDLDAAIVGLLGSSADPVSWARLTAPVDPDDRRAARQLWEDARSAKEILSRAASTFVHVPALDLDVPLGRPQFEDLVRPLLDQTIDATARAVRAAGAGDPAAVFLVGGSSRIPLVATLLHRRFRVAPTVLEQPELVVAQGSVESPPAEGADRAEPALVTLTKPPAAPPRFASGAPAARRVSRRAVVATAVLGSAALATAGAYAIWRSRGDDDTVTYEYHGELDSARRVVDMAFSPTDDNLLVIGSSESGVRFFDASTRAPVGEPLTGHADRVTAVAFSPDGRTVASADTKGTIVFSDVATRAPLGPRTAIGGGMVYSLAYNPDGSLLAVGSGDPLIRILDVATRAPVGKPLNGHEASVRSVAFGPGGLLASGGGVDHAVRLWDVATRTAIVGPLLGHTDLVHAVAFSPDGRTLASGSEDSTVRLWDVSTRNPIGDPLSHGEGNRVTDLLFTPDGRTLVTMSDGLRVMFWDTGTRARAGENISVSASRLALNRAGRTLATGGDGWAIIYTIKR